MQNMKNIDNPNEARRLLRRFYDGLATADEQKMLTGYLLTTEDLPDDLSAEVPFFAAMESASELSPGDIEISDGFKQHLDRLVDRLDGESGRRKLRLKRWRLLSAVASIAVIVAVCLNLGGGKSLDVVEGDSDVPGITAYYDDEVTDPQEALKIAGNAVAHLTSRMRGSAVIVDSVRLEINNIKILLSR